MSNAAGEGSHPEVEEREERAPEMVAEQWVTVATGLTEARANELALVLTARNVPFQRQAGLRGWELWVPLADAPTAATELTLYRHENAKAVGTRPLEENDRIAELSRMLGGSVAPAEAGRYAKKLLAEARESAPLS